MRPSRYKNRRKARNKWKPREENVYRRWAETFVVVELDREDPGPAYTSKS